MYRKFFVLFFAGLCACASAADQKAPIAFDAASVRMAAPPDFQGGRGRGNAPQAGAKYDARQLDIRTMPLRDVITAAYRLKDYQLEGPEWIKTTLVDIHATLPEGASEGQIPEMLQTLLAERFGMKVHTESKDQPVYFLTVAKGGAKLKDAPPDDPDSPKPHVDPNGPDFGFMGRMAGSKMEGDPARGMVITDSTGLVMKVSMSAAGIHMETSKMDMATLTEQLSLFLDRPVIDKTALKGNYQIAIDLSMEEMMNVMSKQGFQGGGPPPGAPGGPGGGGFGPQGGFPGGPGGGGFGGGSDTTGSNVLQSIQKLGLKLDPEKAPEKMIVIDHLEKTPTDN